MSSGVEVIRGEPSPPDAEVQPNADVASESERCPVSLSDEQLVDRLAEVEAATQPSVGPSQEAPPPAEKAKKYGNQRKLSAAEKRVAVTLLVAEAHEKTMADVAPTMFETFKSFGLIYNSQTRDFKFFTAPTFRYEMVDAGMEQFKKDMIAAAKPAARPRPKPKPKVAPKQMSITSFLR